jgi:hypothetical protein
MPFKVHFIEIHTLTLPDDVTKTSLHPLAADGLFTTESHFPIE